MPPEAETGPDTPGSGRIQDGVHILPVRVYWEDTDAGGIVYHASYLRFMERGRTEMLRLLGLAQTDLRDEAGLLYVVRRMDIDFRQPGKFDLALAVHTSLTKLGAASLDLHQSVRHGEAILAEARVRCASIGRTGRPARAPGSVRAAFEPMLKRDGYE